MAGIPFADGSSLNAQYPVSRVHVVCMCCKKDDRQAVGGMRMHLHSSGHMCVDAS